MEEGNSSTHLVLAQLWKELLPPSAGKSLFCVAPLNGEGSTGQFPNTF